MKDKTGKQEQERVLETNIKNAICNGKQIANMGQNKEQDNNIQEQSESDEEVTVPISPPMADFIIYHAKNGRLLEDGMYYHFTEVSRLIKLYNSLK